MAVKILGQYKSCLALSFILFLVYTASADDVIPDSWICSGEDAASRCALSCILYPTYVTGYCNVENQCTCVRREAVPPSSKPVQYGPCTSDNSDSKCSLNCLFFNKFSGGFCNKGFCYCIPK